MIWLQHPVSRCSSSSNIIANYILLPLPMLLIVVIGDTWVYYV